MASLVSVAQQPQLCAYCHQKAKYGNYQYCSKTCATQAGTLCNYCQKKPKYQNYDFCGKNCASLAGANNVRTAGATTQPQLQTAPKNTAGAAYTGNSQKAPNSTFDPVQLAKLVVQHIPQVQAMMAPAVQSQAPPVAAPSQSSPKAGPPPAAKPPRNNPFTNFASKIQTLTTNSNDPALQSTQPDITQVLPECLIPGCGKPVHVDSSGSKTSEYCSKRHREQAVADGLVSPCIMCLTLPQSDTDYFCSRECREEAMNKPAET